MAGAELVVPNVRVHATVRPRRRVRFGIATTPSTLVPWILATITVTGNCDGLAFRTSCWLPPGRTSTNRSPRPTGRSAAAATTPARFNGYRVTPSPLQLRLSHNNNELLPSPLQTLRAPSTNQMNDAVLAPFQIQSETLARILVPSLLSSLAAFLLFPHLSLGLAYLINDAATFAVLGVDSSQFIQNYLTVTSLTLSVRQ